MGPTDQAYLDIPRCANQVRAVTPTRLGRLGLLACLASLLAYLLCSQVVPQFWDQLAEAVGRH